jgi:hypothetical protein
MKKSSACKNRVENPADFVPEESRHAWKIWKKLTIFSEFLWDAYEHDFLTLAASEPPPKRYPTDDLPF